MVLFYLLVLLVDVQYVVVMTDVMVLVHVSVDVLVMVQLVMTDVVLHSLPVTVTHPLVVALSAGLS